MNTMKQLLALLRFQFATFPFIVLLPAVCLMPYALQFVTTFAGPLFLSSLGFLVHDPFSWLFLPLIGIVLLAPEALLLGNSNAAAPSGLEFLLTRAVNRSLLLRARSMTFFIVVLAVPLAAYLVALRSPVLLLNELDKAVQEEVLARMPGSALKSGLIVIPNGNTLLQSWRAWSFMCVAIGIQVTVYFVYPLKHRSYIFWGLVAALFLVPITIILTHMGAAAIFSPSENLFFVFVARQPLFWGWAIATLIIVQPWCERRFARTEQ